MKDYRNRFGFKLGTTSYILHDKTDNMVKNADFLKDHMDEVQLLFFGKDYLDDLIDSETINRLHQIKQKSNISYIVHLPLDLNLLKPDKNEIKNSISIINRLAESIIMLDINKFILHIDRYNFLKNDTVEPDNVSRKLFTELLERLDNELIINPELIFIENTNYDLTAYGRIIMKKKFNICLDLGHLFITGLDMDRFVNVFNDRIGVIHFHGFNENRDHMAIDVIEREKLSMIFNYLRNYKNTVIIEVFNEKDLEKSLEVLDLNSRFLI